MIRDIEQGKVMIVTDLHGDGFDYRQILKVYEKHKEKGLVDFLVFIGDLIHSYPGKKDESANIVQDLIDKGANDPDSDIICLLGNHEFVHIYHIPLLKGHLEFTTWFERRISRNRQPFIDFFEKMPFALRTSGGVLVHHTGAAEIYDADNDFNLSYLQKFSHFDILKRLADTHPDLNPFGKYNHEIGQTIINTPEVSRLWDMLMNGNERQYGDVYHSMVTDFLQFMSSDRQDKPLKALVSGHIGVEYGAELVGDSQLRLCSSSGCGRDLEKKYLLFKAEQFFEDASQLMECCRDVY